MFSIGQHVIHPGQGVCTVVGFREDTPQPMLLLETKQGHAQTILMYPVAQADRLHAAISQQDAEHLLSHYDELECDTFTERNSSLEEIAVALGVTEEDAEARLSQAALN